MGHSTGRLRGALGSVALGLAALVLCAVVGELALRIAGATRAPSERRRLDVYRPSATLSHALRPDWEARFASEDFDTSVRTNALGFRGPDVSPQKASDRVRILVVGDSFAFGWGVEEEESFGRVLERALRDAGVPAEVIGAGVPGYATDQHLLFLRERGFALDPDLVLLAVCSNDPSELAWKELVLDDERLPTASVSRRRFINRRGEMRFLNASLLELPELPLPESMRAWLVDHSLAWGWLRIRLARAWVEAMERVSAPEPIGDDALPTQPIAELSPGTIDRLLRGSATFRVSYHRHLVDAIARDAEAAGVPLRTLLVERTGAEAPGIDAGCTPARCLDQVALFTRESDPEAYLPVDGHWSARGHARVGEALAAWLLADPELLPRPL